MRDSAVQGAGPGAGAGVQGPGTQAPVGPKKPASPPPSREADPAPVPVDMPAVQHGASRRGSAQPLSLDGGTPPPSPARQQVADAAQRVERATVAVKSVPESIIAWLYRKLSGG